MQVCYRCKIEKDDSEFYKNKTKKTGLSSNCNQCNRELSRERYITNKDAIKQYHSEYRKNNRLKLRSLQDKYRNSLSDGYVTKLLEKEFGDSLSISKDNIELKRLELQIKRIIKQKRISICYSEMNKKLQMVISLLESD